MYVLSTRLSISAQLKVSFRVVQARLILLPSLDKTIANDGILTFLEAFQAANSNQPYGDALAGSITEPDTIQFDSALFADGILKTIFVNDGELNIFGNLNIEGPGAELLTFDAAEQNRVFNISAGIFVNLDGVTITGGSTSDDGGGIYNNGTLTVDQLLSFEQYC